MVYIPGGAFLKGVEGERNPWEEPAERVKLSGFCIDVYEFPNVVGEMPRAKVSQNEAAMLCNEVGKRLCTGGEWERACRGEKRWRYSYGGTKDAERCNTPIEGNAPIIPGEPPLASIGSYPECVSPDGVHDLNGSLSEWVADPWPGKEGWRTLRGGTMWNQTHYGQDCLSRHGHPRDGWRNEDDGFRCCRVPG